MIVRPSRRAMTLALGVFVASVGACTMPRPGPNSNEIFSGSVLREGNAYVVAVGDRVNRALDTPMAMGFSSSLRNAALLGGDTIRTGDTVAVTVFENVPEGLLTSSETPGAQLTELQVDSEGFIYVPFAGRVRAAGSSPEALRSAIANQLDQQTPDPQVYVSRTGGDGASVSVVGAVGAQGVYPITRPNRRLTAMLASAGGVDIPTQTAMITVSRGSITDRIWLDDLFEHPELDIAMRGGDRIYVEADQRRYTVLGATGDQALITFDRRELTAIEALAQVGGLDPTRADPTGVFVFRDEPVEVAQRILNQTGLVGDQRFVYVLDLTAPNGMFMARDFQIRDGDTIYVTEASSVAWNRQISVISGALSATGSASATLTRIRAAGE
ncbi:polysaccharide biosynthesis/export family protein [Rhodobacter sp. NTK016B]|uniref:polysaccharide biosynthesis/export family protein n=1 Tax=Rhodobacter sp. NTK016B TaxID=2759676 RepID=UPI0032E39836